MIGVFVGFSRIFLLGILILKVLTARCLYKSFGVKGLKQVARNTGTDSYTATKRMACYNSRWKVTNQSKD
jgi:hypothetical protein